MRAAILLLALAFAGCLRVGPGEDLHLVCERESTSPWHPYAPGELLALARVEGAPPPDWSVEAADSLLTFGARAYDAFEARIAPDADAPGRWRFWANGTLGNATDIYDVRLPRANDTIEPPGTVVARAVGIAEREEAAEAHATHAPYAWWSGEEPGCVRLRYATADLVVNVDKAQVVAILQPNG